MGTEETQKSIDQIAAQHAEMMASYQNMIDESMAKYNAMVTEAQASLSKLVAASQPVPVRKPETVWTEAADGEKLLIMNKEAVDFFNNIFELMGKVAAELSKPAPKGRR